MTYCHNSLVVGIPLLAALGCASASPGEVHTHTSKPQPVDARMDNARMLAQLTPGLVVTLDIDGKEISLRDARVFMVPQRKPRRQEGELITLTGLSQGKVVSTVQVSDERVNVEEKKGLVIMEQRAVTGALPLPARIDTVEVRLPGATEAVRLDVHVVIDEFCKSSQQAPLCQSEKR